ncbi:LysR family transcriptional regulator [Paraburkholderia sacchari]|uniref:LysR family transcriptional regulator n=1 Tax=Paraburkholderia sacchari TaxID=159450 RepID=UPI002467B5CD|nr:LysR family transcriptional regulator [Paraburkholderia sacchari]
MNRLIAAMRTFLKVVDMQGFTRAAEQLQLSPSRVTRHISELESHLGVRLLQRSTRRIVLTDVGARYTDGCRALLTELERIETCAMRESGRVCGDLHVVVPGSLMLPELAVLFADFRTRYADVSLRITLTEAEVDLLAGGFDVGMVADRIITSESWVSRALAHAPLVAVASPAYLMAAPEPQRPVDLARHRMITHTAYGKTLQLIDGDGINHSVPHDASFAVDSALMQRHIALAGASIAVLPEFVVASDVRFGTLIRVLDEYRIGNDDVTVKLVYPARELLPGKVRAFVDLAVSHFNRPLIRSGARRAPRQREALSNDTEVLSA